MEIESLVFTCHARRFCLGIQGWSWWHSKDPSFVLQVSGKRLENPKKNRMLRNPCENSCNRETTLHQPNKNLIFNQNYPKMILGIGWPRKKAIRKKMPSATQTSQLCKISGPALPWRSALLKPHWPWRGRSAPRTAGNRDRDSWAAGDGHWGKNGAGVP